jgi:uncharacterized protein (DUF39 family)
MVQKSYEEINAKIRAGNAVVVTADEVIGIARDMGVKRAAEKIDVVTTGTFGIMCSSGAFLNFWHTKPKIKMQHVYLNDVPAYGGIAAVDCYLGATEIPERDSANMHYPGHFRHGGGHVIEALIAGKSVQLRADAMVPTAIRCAITVARLHLPIFAKPLCFRRAIATKIIMSPSIAAKKLLIPIWACLSRIWVMCIIPARASFRR